jgi:hypothetical protein
VERVPLSHLTFQQLLVSRHEFTRLNQKAQQLLWISRVMAGLAPTLNALPLTRDAFVRL